MESGIKQRKRWPDVSDSLVSRWERLPNEPYLEYKDVWHSLQLEILERVRGGIKLDSTEDNRLLLVGRALEDV